MNISIIIPVHNSQGTLPECLTAILKSDYKNYEIILVDDDSTDNSANIAKQFPCHIINTKINKGAAAARNLGAQEAKNEILLFVDSDIIIKPDSISKIIAHLSKDNTIAGVVGVYDIYNRYTNFLSQYKHMIACYRDKLSENLDRDSFRGAFFAIKKECFKNHKFDGLFNKASVEDIEFSRELISLGYKFIIDKSNKVEHLKRFTMKSFLKNQYYRSKDLINVYLNKKAYEFYLSKKRTNRYDRIYFLRVPISWLIIVSLTLFLATQNYIILLVMCLLSLASIFIEKYFLMFCFLQKGLPFTIKCTMIYFVDGLVSGIGIAKGIIENYFNLRIGKIRRTNP